MVHLLFPLNRQTRIRRYQSSSGDFVNVAQKSHKCWFKSRHFSDPASYANFQDLIIFNTHISLAEQRYPARKENITHMHTHRGTSTCLRILSLRVDWWFFTSKLLQHKGFQVSIGQLFFLLSRIKTVPFFGSDTGRCFWWKALARTCSRKASQQASPLPRWQRSLLSNSRQDLRGRDTGYHVSQECFLLPLWTWDPLSNAEF